MRVRRLCTPEDGSRRPRLRERMANPALLAARGEAPFELEGERAISQRTELSCLPPAWPEVEATLPRCGKRFWRKVSILVVRHFSNEPPPNDTRENARTPVYRCSEATSNRSGAGAQAERTVPAHAARRADTLRLGLQVQSSSPASSRCRRQDRSAQESRDGTCPMSPSAPAVRRPLRSEIQACLGPYAREKGRPSRLRERRSALGGTTADGRSAEAKATRQRVGRTE